MLNYHHRDTKVCIRIGHADTGIIFLCIWNSPWRFGTLSQSLIDWLFNTQSRVLQPDRIILEHNEKATLNIDMPYTLQKLLA